MTCQCTCGKHMLVDISKSVTIPVHAAAGPGYPVTVYHVNNTADFPLIDIVPNTACAAPALPTGWTVHEVP